MACEFRGLCFVAAAVRRDFGTGRGSTVVDYGFYESSRRTTEPISIMGAWMTATRTELHRVLAIWRRRSSTAARPGVMFNMAGAGIVR